jgi:hypothetical protein
MEWLEIYPIPEACSNCTQKDCYNCDTAGKRWMISKEAELRTSRKLLVSAVKRLECKIAEIDAQLKDLHK